MRSLHGTKGRVVLPMQCSHARGGSDLVRTSGPGNAPSTLAEASDTRADALTTRADELIHVAHVYFVSKISHSNAPLANSDSLLLTLRSYRRQPFGCLRTLMVMNGLPNRKNGGGQKILLSGLRAMLLGLPASRRSTMSKRKTR